MPLRRSIVHPNDRAALEDALLAQYKRQGLDPPPLTPPPKKPFVMPIPQYVYFMQRADGAIKIGVSGNVNQRRKDLECASGPLKVLASMDGGFPEEHAFHRQFASSRLHGEWFSPTDELLELVASIGLKSNHR
jgi:hypothetical protein